MMDGVDVNGARPIEDVCPFCGAQNLISRDRFFEEPHCEQCGKNMVRVDPAALTAASFDAHANDGLPLLVHFWAPWCGPCRKMRPHFEAAGARLGRHARLATVDVEAEQGLAGRFGIRNVPTLLLLRGDQVIMRSSGEPQDIVAWTRNALGL